MIVLGLKGKYMSKSGSGNRSTRRSMTSTAAARIQSATARDNGGEVSSGSFAARAQSAAARAVSGSKSNLSRNVGK
jgi:hypothetical protein